jgi:soluble lytic murein transglycosylase
VALIVVGAVVFVNRYYPLQYTDIIYKYASEYDLKPDLICAVINAESSFDKDAVSGAGASGLMQIMESTAYWLAPKMKIEDFGYAEIFDPDVNIRFGCYYLNMLKKQYGDTDVALCAYNAGSGNVDKWLANPEYSGDGKTLDYIPFKETRDYVKKVSETQKIYSFILFFKAH